ncbi:MAG: type II toxin-antitoxin system PemK/MazF family toxin [Herpetosiphon sp.]|nr:type II toxin-antitoxin system PemK/MazF family toxin [Herpetosiphon sp.]
MKPKRGELWLADLNPIRGSEQAGTRPVMIFQQNRLNRLIPTVVAIPFTTNLKRAKLPSCVLISAVDSGLDHDSVALCHQIRVLDSSRLIRQLGTLPTSAITAINTCVLWTLDIP